MEETNTKRSDLLLGVAIGAVTSLLVLGIGYYSVSSMSASLFTDPAANSETENVTETLREVEASLISRINLLETNILLAVGSESTGTEEETLFEKPVNGDDGQEAMKVKEAFGEEEDIFTPPKGQNDDEAQSTDDIDKNMVAIMLTAGDPTNEELLDHLAKITNTDTKYATDLLQGKLPVQILDNMRAFEASDVITNIETFGGQATMEYITVVDEDVDPVPLEERDTDQVTGHICDGRWDTDPNCIKLKKNREEAGN